MVTIPLALRTVAGLDKKETKAIVFIVQEWKRIEEKRKEHSRYPPRELTTEDVTKHLKTKHPETMKVINRFREQGLLRLRPRNSAGPSGNGWDGALFGALTPSGQAVSLVEAYFAEP
jgi:hypothetical protein